MTSGFRRTLHWMAAVAVVSLAAAVPVAISPRWGWLEAILVALIGGALFARHVARRYADPLDRLAEAARPHLGAPHASAEDLARMVAYEFRDAIRQLEEAVAERKRRETALRHTVDGVVLVDGDGLVEYANPASRTMLHERVLELSRRLASPELDRVVRMARELGTSVSEEVTVRTPAAHQVLARALPLADDGAVLLLQDLAESYRLDRVRRDFVANVSHELKTPVAGVRALADVAAAAYADGDTASAGVFVTKLRTEAERLSDLVSDLLDLSAVESGSLPDLQPVDVLEVARTAAEHARTIADGKGIPIEVSGASSIVEADATQLTTAVQNLVDNAVRYSESGSVRVRVGHADGWIRIAVTDEGIGIPEKDLPRIFERFYRVDRARSRLTGGTGLGLSIVRHVAENHGGRVEVTSRLGRGSTFTLSLPAPDTASGEGTAA